MADLAVIRAALSGIAGWGGDPADLAVIQNRRITDHRISIAYSVGGDPC